jgi:F-type H+-transporting ATPase subunit a
MLLAIAPLIFPVLMQTFGLLTGLIHAYIFALLAMVYIATATRAHHTRQSETVHEVSADPASSHSQHEERDV